nr:hypothetical protein CFP56_30695 [Quercus suber]
MAELPNIRILSRSRRSIPGMVGLRQNMLRYSTQKFPVGRLVKMAIRRSSTSVERRLERHVLKRGVNAATAVCRSYNRDPKPVLEASSESHNRDPEPLLLLSILRATMDERQRRLLLILLLCRRRQQRRRLLILLAAHEQDQRAIDDQLRVAIWSNTRPIELRMPFRVPRKIWSIKELDPEVVRRLTRFTKEQILRYSSHLFGGPVIRVRSSYGSSVTATADVAFFVVAQRLAFADRWYNQATQISKSLAWCSRVFNGALKLLAHRWSRTID